MTPRAFTLIESLAVVTLMALAATVLAIGAGGASDLAAARSARASVLEVDARARVIARQGRAVLVVVDGKEVVAIAAADPDRSPLCRRSLPAAAELVISLPHTATPAGAVKIGTDGRSEDYVITVMSGRYHGRSIVAGITGSATELRSPPAGEPE